jgi:hypothetical protein
MFLSRNLERILVFSRGCGRYRGRRTGRDSGGGTFSFLVSVSIVTHHVDINLLEGVIKVHFYPLECSFNVVIDSFRDASHHGQQRYIPITTMDTMRTSIIPYRFDPSLDHINQWNRTFSIHTNVAYVLHDLSIVITGGRIPISGHRVVITGSPVSISIYTVMITAHPVSIPANGVMITSHAISVPMNVIVITRYGAVITMNGLMIWHLSFRLCTTQPKT